MICASIFLSSTVFADDADRLLRRANRYFAPLPEVMPGAEKDTAEKIAAGVDNLPVSPGAKGDLGTRNSPTVLNAGLQRRQFWDGRAENLVEQAKGPILNPIEMGMPDEQTVVNKISGIDEYRKAFAEVFTDVKPAITYHNIAEAIAAFERTLLTPSRS